MTSPEDTNQPPYSYASNHGNPGSTPARVDSGVAVYTVATEPRQSSQQSGAIAGPSNLCRAPPLPEYSLVAKPKISKKPAGLGSKNEKKTGATEQSYNADFNPEVVYTQVSKSEKRSKRGGENTNNGSNKSKKQQNGDKEQSYCNVEGFNRPEKSSECPDSGEKQEHTYSNYVDTGDEDEMQGETQKKGATEATETTYYNTAPARAPQMHVPGSELVMEENELYQGAGDEPGGEESLDMVENELYVAT